jgi:hypothetical protein
MKNHAFFIILALVPGGWMDLNAQVSLARENLEFRINPEHFTVNGEYLYKNSADKSLTQTVFYPFAFQYEKTKVDTLTITDLSHNSVIKPAKKTNYGVFYLLNFDNFEQKKIRVSYRQDHDGKSVTYMLTADKYWLKPVPDVKYTIIAEEGIIVDSVNYKPGSPVTDGATTTYTWHKANFTPDRDLVIWFHLPAVK